MFTHLRAYSTYSIGYGAMQVSEYVKRVKELGMTACALTERGVLYSAIEFIEECEKNNIKPILGMEVTVKEEDGVYPLLLLAENEGGYFNLVSLATVTQKHKINGKPYATPEEIKEAGKRGGLFLITGHSQSKVGQFLFRNRFHEARETLKEYQAWFGEDHVYLEVQNHERLTDMILTPRVIAEGRALNIPVILTNQTLYTTPEMAKKHLLIQAVVNGVTVDKMERSILPNCHVRSEEEMASLYPAYPELLTDTENLAKRIHLSLRWDQKYYPMAKIPEGETEESYFIKRVKEGFKRRYGSISDEEKRKLIDRLNQEFPVIQKAGYIGYLLIVSEFIQWAKENGIDVGKGRGSGAGSLTLQCLGITDINPLRWGLLFERFLNLERVSSPDIDTDFAPEGRDKVIEHCKALYGEDKVVSIITFSTIAARAAIRDAGRATGVPLGIVDKVAKLVPKKPEVTLSLALGEDPDKKDYYSPELVSLMDDPTIKNLVENAKLIEGLVRGTGIHAAGKIISSVPVHEVVPLQYDEETGVWMTQFDGPTCEKIGLMKMDFLGLDTLTLMRRTLELIEKTRGLKLNPDTFPLDDPNVFREIYGKGRTVAIFQFESIGMRRMLQDFKPTKMEDLILLNAAYRPGPMQFIPSIIENKKNPEKIHYDLPELKAIFSETYGFPVYQEQVMELFRVVAGYTLGEADQIRRAMAKKKLKELVQHKERFTQAAVQKGMSPERAESFWEEILKFAEYGFNKSHAAAYSVNSYLTAYLKYYYPAEFMASAMSVQKLEKLPGLIQECREMGLSVYGPDVNLSEEDFFPEGKAVRFGLRQIKGVGSAADMIVEERRRNGPYKDLSDFLYRTNVNSRVMKALVEAGALDTFGYERSALFKMAEEDWKRVTKVVKEIRNNDTPTLFNDEEVRLPLVPREVPPWSMKEELKREYAVLQAYLNGHPVDQFQKTKEYTSLVDLNEEMDGEKVTVLALIEKIQILHRKKDKAPMAKLLLSDATGQMEAILFHKTYAVMKEKLQEQEVRILRGVFRYEEGEAQIWVEEVLVPSQKLTFYVKVPSRTNPLIKRLTNLIERHVGRNPLYVFVEDEKALYPAKKMVDESFLEEAQQELGKDMVKLVV